MTIEEDLTRLENYIRRLKIDYAAYLNGGLPRPPTALAFRIESTIRKYSGGSVDLTLRQRFRLNSLAQGYTAQSGLWRRKLRQKEQRARAADTAALPAAGEDGHFSVVWSIPDKAKLKKLLEAVSRAQSEAGGGTTTLEPARFADFMGQKTQEFQKALGCKQIRISVFLHDGRVKLRATRAAAEHENGDHPASASATGCTVA